MNGAVSRRQGDVGFVMRSHKIPLPRPVKIDGVMHESLTVPDAIEIALKRPIESGGVVRRSLVVQRLTTEHRKQIRRSHFTAQKRGIAAVQLVTGLDRQALDRLDQADLAAIDEALALLDEEFVELDAVLSKVVT